MKNTKANYLFLLILMLTTVCSEMFACNDPYSLEVLPSETGVLFLPNDMRQDWKNICYNVNSGQGIAEYIPSDQNENSMTDLITICCVDMTNRNKNVEYNINFFFEGLKKQALKSKDGVAEFKILEKNDADIIYEYIWRDNNPKYPMEHDIARLFMTDGAIHRISYTHKGELMSLAQKQKWFDIFKMNSSIQSIDKAYKYPQAFSLLYRLPPTVHGEKS